MRAALQSKRNADGAAAREIPTTRQLLQVRQVTGFHRLPAQAMHGHPAPGRREP